MTSKRVVIVGGGFAGTALATHLSKVATVTLVDRQAYLEVNWASLRGVVDPTIQDKIIIPYKEIPNLGTFVLGTVVGVTNSTVTLRSGQTLEYDYLAFCMGSTYSDTQFKGEAETVYARKAAFQADAKALEAARSILVVGGGPCGVELAAEIVAAFPGKAVTVVQSSERLLADKKPQLGANALKWLQQKGVQVMLNERVIKAETGEHIRQSTGAPLPADKVYWCVGQKPNSDFLGASHPEVLDSRGFIKVDSSFRVEGHSNWIALGDVTNIPETKLAYLAQKQGIMAAASLASAIQRGPDNARWGVWKPNGGFEAMLVTLGPQNGVAQLGPVTFKGFMVKKMKSEGLFISKIRGDLGLKA